MSLKSDPCSDNRAQIHDSELIASLAGDVPVSFHTLRAADSGCTLRKNRYRPRQPIYVRFDYGVIWQHRTGLTEDYTLTVRSRCQD
jgi:hypothetical protein